jgi:caffeoyl-CoA O-methyltransferase
MSTSFTLSPALHDYVLAHSSGEHALLAALRAETRRATPLPQMQISAEQGLLMQVLVRAMGVQRYLEVGVFTGYSSLAVALALPEDGRVTACDVSEEWTAIARRYWADAGVAHKIDLHLAPALQTLDGLLAKGAAGAYDMAFIDADKENYLGYYQRAVELVRRGGLILIDNTLWSGRVADISAEDVDTRAIRKLNKTVAKDARVQAVLTHMGDGLTMAVKL